MRLVLEVEGSDEQAVPACGGADLVAFMSFATCRGFGSAHPLIALAERLQQAFGVNMGPLTTFYETAPADQEDAAKLDLAWQPAAPLRSALAALVFALATDEQCQALTHRASADAIGEDAAALLTPLEEADAAGKRVRLVYAL